MTWRRFAWAALAFFAAECIAAVWLTGWIVQHLAL